MKKPNTPHGFCPTLLCSVALAASCASVPAFGAERPNIIVILTDDSGFSDPGSYGGEIETPNIDRLAREGVRFSNFYTAGRCSPTRAALLTGRDPSEVGFAAGTLSGWNREYPLPAYRGRLSADYPTLSELLRGGGYRTFMAGKWHLGGTDIRDDSRRQEEWKRAHPERLGWVFGPEEIEAEFGAMPVQRGFDRFFGVLEGETDFFFLPGDRHKYLDGNTAATLDYTRTYTIEASTTRREGKRFRHHGKTAQAFHDTDGLTDRAITMIADAIEQETPFFLYLAYRAPHSPLQAPKELVDKYLDRYRDLESVERARLAGVVREGVFPAAAQAQIRTGANGTLSARAARVGKENLAHTFALHAAMKESIDQNVGRLLGKLEKTGQADNTVIFYLSDNGGAAQDSGGFHNAPFRGVKAQVWEGGIRTHFIAHWPGKFPPNSVNPTFAWVADILPTCLDITAMPYPAEFRGRAITPPTGRSILPALLGKTMPPPEFLFFNIRGQQAVIEGGRWKLLIEPGWHVQTLEEPGIVYELYDLQTDPAETQNLADQHPEIVKRLADASAQWQEKHGLVDYAEILKIHHGDN